MLEQLLTRENLSFLADIIGILGVIGLLYTIYEIRENAKEIKKNTEQAERNARETKLLNDKLDREQKRLNEPISVVLTAVAPSTETITLPVPIRRKDLSRGELMGRLGMINSGQKFSVAYLNNPKFFRQLDAIIEGDGSDILEIQCQSEELEYFKPKSQPSASP